MAAAKRIKRSLCNHCYEEVWPGIYRRCPRCGKSQWWHECRGGWYQHMPPENLVRHGYGAHFRHISRYHRQVWDDVKLRHVLGAPDVVRRWLTEDARHYNYME